MLAVGIWLGVFGYTTFYYGVKLWAGAPVAFAEALGLGGSGGTSSAPAAAGSSARTSAPAPSSTHRPAPARNSHGPHHIGGP